MELFWVSLLIFFFHDSLCDRTSLKIYEGIQSDLFCFRRLNSTHQIGCASDRSGTIGIIHLIKDHLQLVNATSNPLYTPSVVAIPMELFNMDNMFLLKHAKHVLGVLILYNKNSNNSRTYVPEYFSPDQSCPNRNFGFYTDSINPKYASCKQQQWNKHTKNLALGMMFEDWEMPVFIITNETSINLIQKYYKQFNEPNDGVARSYPLLAVQLTSFMLAAKDSDTCMRRNNMVANLNPVRVCDPLSDKNIITTLFPTNKSEIVPEKSVIVVGCRLDAFTMFDRLSPGAHSTVTGLVVLLAIANTLSRNKAILENRKHDRNVLFTIFNGEAFDYIGSSRVVFDMQHEQFPFPLDDDIKKQPALLGLNHISHFIELSQLAPTVEDNSTVYVHSDPVSLQNKTVKAEVMNLFDIVANYSRDTPNINITFIEDNKPLPPASFQSFLREEKNIPGIVIADHLNEFKNRYYNSMFDTNDKLNVTDLTSILTELSEILAKTIYHLVTEEEPPSLSVNESLISGLLDCYLVNASCDLFHQIANPSMTGELRVEPYPMYISIQVSNNFPNPITQFTRYLLAYLTGTKLENRSRRNCTKRDQIYNYDWMTGPDVNSSGICIKSTVTFTIAESPVNVLNDWKSTNYSTWTESIWSEPQVRIFLKPSLSQEIWTLFTGIVILLLSVLVVYFLNSHASVIFVKPLVSC